MILIDNIFVEESILTTHFCCNLQKCLGACCIEGESGAPLNEDELEILDKVYPKVKKYLPEKNQKILDEKGLYVKDSDGDWTTTLTHSNGPCAFVIFENNVALCAIEKTYNEGKIQWQKPISCHLYPIRVEYKNGFTYLRYHQWEICRPALKNGQIPMFRFLQAPLTRAFGEKFFNRLEEIYEQFKQKNSSSSPLHSNRKS
ncbi:MAG: DUF3109 family protein [Bacteroidia bacterium]